MSLLDTIGRSITKDSMTQTPNGIAISQQQLSRSEGGVSGPREQLARYRGWVYAAATVRARAVAAVPSHLMNGQDEIFAHPFIDLWKRPAPGYFGSTWRQVLYIHLYLTGNAYHYIGTDSFGVPRMLLPLPPDRISVKPGKDRLIDAYVLQTGNGTFIEIDPALIMHTKLPNPHNAFYGMGIVEAAAAAVDISEYGHAYANSTFRNHSVPAAWIKMSPDTPQGDRRKLARLIMDQFKGVANGNRTLVTGDAIESITPLSVNPAELEFLQGMKFSRDEIFALHGVHRSMAGMADDINLANAAAGEYTFAKWVVTPDIDLLQNAMDLDILPLYDSKLSLKFDDPIPVDETRRGNNAQIAWQAGAITRDEFRDMIGFDHTENANDGDVYSIPYTISIVPTGTGAEVPRPAGVLMPGQQDNPAPEPGDGPDSPAKTVVKAYEARKEAVRGAGERYIAAPQAKLSLGMESFFAEQSKRVSGQMRNASRQGPVGMTKAFDTDQEARRLETYLLAYLASGYAQGLRYVASLLGAEPPSSLPPGGQSHVNAAANNIARKVTTTTFRQIEAAIAKAHAEGGGVATILAAVAAVFATAQATRAPLIGRQETSTMFHQATIRASVDAGLTFKAWVTAGDDKVEQTCKVNEYDGPVPIGSVFPSGDGAPPTLHHPNCRCVLLPLTAAEARH